MIKLVKLDRRNNGFLTWKYYVELRPSFNSSSDRKKLFFKWREWCWKEWGPSKELHDFDHNDLFDGECSSNSNWCWLNKEGTLRIYLKDDLQGSAFMLRWT